LPDAPGAIRRLADAGYRIVLVSNQSGVARGLFDENQLARVHERMEQLLSQSGARLDASYYCPFLSGPEAAVEAYRRESELRKPRPGMLLQAAEELGLDLRRSWIIGDSVQDVEAGRRAGCRTILLTRGQDEASLPHQVHPDHIAADLAEAAEIVLDNHRASPLPQPARRDDVQRLDEEVVARLDAIRAQLERLLRREGQQDFSLLRLFAALWQMFAIAAAVWGGAALLGESSADAGARFGLACFLQLASLSALAADRFR
jgi:histidinol-phosphate phosphatase family protein